MNSTKKLNFALFGIGRIGGVHFSNLTLNDRACVKHIVELDKERAKEALLKYNLSGQIPVTSIEKVEEVLSDASINAILIATPNHTHETLILMGLKYGKAVFCESPLSSSVASVIKCYESAKSHNIPLICGLNRRFDPQMQLLFSRVKAGYIGKIRMIKLTCREPKSMTTSMYLTLSGGIFLDSVVHDIDLACYMVGEFPLSVFAQGNATFDIYGECNDVDTALMVLKFPCGALASLEISKETNIGFYHKLEVLGESGLLESENKRSLDIVHWDNSGVKLEPVSSDMDRYSDSFKLELEHAVDIMEGKYSTEENAVSTIVSTIIAAAGKASIERGTQISRHLQKRNTNMMCPIMPHDIIP